jgi:dipeptidyl aminopeptidase/acylaminoacyl peptidase
VRTPQLTRQISITLCILALIPWSARSHELAFGDRVRLYRALHAGTLASAVARPQESVREELIRLQKQTGLSLASFGFGLDVVLFDKRTLVQIPISTGLALVRGTISRDGTEIIVSRVNLSASDSLELLRTDGSNTRKLPFSYAGTVASPVQSLCWSYDQSKLAVGVHRGSPEVKLEILNLGSGVDQTVAPSVKELTSQCWSSDDKRIVYEAGDGVRIYEVGNDKSSTLVAPGGKDPTWSPDGNWIAFLDHNTYYAIRPNGQDRKKIFHHSNVYSPLWWSPDSRFVAYVALARFAIDDVYELRVRRLEDNSEDRVAEGQISGNFQWVMSPELLRQVEASALE